MSTMASNPFLLSKVGPFSTHRYSSCPAFVYLNKRNFPVVSGMASSIPFPQQPINVDYLEQEFSGHGVIFKGIGDNCVAKMTMENGSKAILMMPTGLIASYKALMWHGSTVELLQSSVSEKQDEEEDNNAALVQGGVSVALDCLTLSNEQVSWSPTNWALHDIKGNPRDSIRVELISSGPDKMVQVKHIVTLKDDVLISEIVVTNNSTSSSLQLSGGILNHLTVSSPDATFAIGLERSDFFGRLPILSPCAIIPPDYGNKRESSPFSQLWKQMFGWGSKDQNNGNQTEIEEEEEEMENGEEDENYKNLRDQMCRIYINAPTDFTIIDRGRRNSVEVGRDGFEELYMFSPGSNHEYYGKYAYICVGHSAVLKPIILQPNESWTGGQRLHNPNL